MTLFFGLLGSCQFSKATFLFDNLLPTITFHLMIDRPLSCFFLSFLFLFFVPASRFSTLNPKPQILNPEQSLRPKRATPHGETRSPPRGLAAHLRRPHWGKDPKRTQQKLLLKRTPREIPTESAKLAPHNVARRRAPLFPWPGTTRMCSFHWTNDLRCPISPASTTRRALALRRATVGKCAPSAAEPLPEQLHLSGQHLGALMQR